MVGRSRDKSASELEALRQLNPEAEIVFIEAELSLVNEVDRVCEVIGRQVSPNGIQLLCMSQGYAPLGNRTFNREGLDESMTLSVYGRVRLAERLIAEKTLAPNARVVSVLGGGKEGHLFFSDMELKNNYSTMNLRGHFTSIMTLAFVKLANDDPGMGFVHYHPGTVSTGMLSRIPDLGWSLWVLMGIFTVLLSFQSISPRESGERTLAVCFGEEYGKGSFSIGYDGTVSGSEELKGYRRDDGVVRKVWQHLEELFERAKSSIDE